MKDSLSKLKQDCESKELKVIFNRSPDFDEESLISPFIHWQPLFDLYIVNQEVVVTIELAGVDIKDLSVYINKRYMVVEGVRKSASFMNKDTCIFHNIEIPYGRFYRRIDFPLLIEPREYQFNMCNGLLLIKFPVMKEKVIPVEDG
ncbi:MAG TPA: Hsp20/alpha crystallin family protein [candidate division WOR-3 bacterium]|uniref:Hsp20/alpha crystallin family protein n=1 Tax=candidate division WOR-3 bacterium TaxID=2052148 RepID=A0A9C9K0W5_UNCW3|nr:Hsp20/alpha crystallin family protein [candidate division WOR-3 bacterium]